MTDPSTRIRGLREARGLSRFKLAVAAGVTERQIVRYEQGESMPPLDVAARMARELGCSLDELADNMAAA